MTGAVGRWAAGVFVVGWLIVMAQWTAAVPSPAGGRIAGPAVATTSDLANQIGHRHVGSPGHEATVQYLVGRLHAIAGVEVAVQRAAGTRVPRYGAVIAYRTTTVLARLTGERAESVLVSAHFDSAPESVGAADNAAGVAAALQGLQALASRGRPGRTVVCNFNGGEEAGLVGADAFFQHPWSRSVVTVVNLDAAGAGGRPLLFRIGGDQRALAQAYGGSAVAGRTTVLAQELFATGLIPSDTDYKVYHEEHGLPCLDVAMYRDGYGYHSSGDGMAALAPATIDHLAAAVQALMVRLADAGVPLGGSAGMATFFDVGGRVVAYDRPTAAVLAAVGLLLTGLALWRGQRASGVAWRTLVATTGALALAGCAGLGLAVLLAAGAAWGLGQPNAWFSQPAWGVAAAALATVAGATAVWRRPADGKPLQTWYRMTAAGLVLWCGLLLVGTAAGVGSSYVALIWTLATAAVLAIAPTRWSVVRGLGLLAWLPGAWVTVQLGEMIVAMVVPVAGRLGPAMPADPLLAVLVALPALALLATGLPLLVANGGWPRRSLLLMAAAGLQVASAYQTPYTAERPKRLHVEHRQTGDKAELVVAGEDAVPLPQSLLTPLGLTADAAAGGTWHAPATPLPGQAPWIQVTTGPAGQRRLRIGAGVCADVWLRLPRSAVSGWSVSSSLPAGKSRFVSLHLVDPPPETALTVTVVPGAVADGELIGYQTTAPDGASAALVARLPAWTGPFAYRSIHVPVPLTVPSADHPRLRRGPGGSGVI
ncbi:MAG: M28 family peptidase, partial [Candidatus Sericytochromatia bacterium]|nr:M28 family peptidase [Candidatus Sericytochromatia bacterium]